MEECSKTSAGAVAGLPDDILVEILSRVPAMSICRFKCVSKAWRSLIADPDYRKKLRQAMQGLFFMTPEKVEDHFSSSFLDLTAGSVSVDVDPIFSFLPGSLHLALQDSCNGLILFRHHKEEMPYDTLGYIVCNPTTKEWRAVPAYGSPRGINHTYLAFDPVVSSHFHLVQFQKTILYMSMSVHDYSSETGTWRHNQTEEEGEQGQSEAWQNHVELSIGPCAFVNGFLHFVVLDSHKQQHGVVVDVQGKERRMFKLPDVVAVNQWRCICIYLGQSQGYLHCITKQSINQDRYELSTWVLQDYDAEEWVLKDTVSSVQFFGEKCRRNLMLDCDMADMHPDCNVVFFFSPCDHKFIAYDMDHKKVSVFATSKCISRFKVCRYIPHFSELPAPLK